MPKLQPDDQGHLRYGELIILNEPSGPASNLVLPQDDLPKEEDEKDMVKNTVTPVAVSA